MPSAISFNNIATSPTPKLNISQGTFPAFIDPKQPPTKKSPWRQIRDVPFGHTATLILPEQLYQATWDKLNSDLKTLRYVKVILKLEDILSGDMFTEYIKKGDVLMLSEGEPGVDDCFSLCEGTLRLELSKETYERAGLQGKPVQSGGRKHVKSRFLVEIDLRQPSMLHGKKGFERIIWAAKNVLNRSLVWLFCDLSKDPNQEKQPITQHHPTAVERGAELTTLNGVLIPTFISGSKHTPPPPPNAEGEETYYEIAEWLDLVSLRSPRVIANDNVDLYISRYTVPSHTESAPVLKQDLRVIRWTGLIPSVWITRLLIEIVKQSRATKTPSWYALNVTSHRTKTVGQINGYNLVVLPLSGLQSSITSPSRNGTKRKRDDVDGKDDDDESAEEDTNAQVTADDVVDEEEVSDDRTKTVEAHPSRTQPTEQKSPSQSKQDGRKTQEGFICFQFIDSGPG